MAMSKWGFDPTHSEVQFKVKHMMITNVTGTFKEVHVDAETEGDDFSKANIKFSAKVNSISTNNEQRDGHLTSPEFFDAEKYPEISFVSSSIKKIDDDGNHEMEGDLTIKGITNKVKLNVEQGGLGKDPWGNTKAGFTVTGKINREDFGLTWNAALETGGVLVSNEVKLNAEIQLVKQ
ncbi:MAG: YceI family protein [Saprospiraceae bacterium]|nr:YceI family protein [Saprospiraceae bacterium]